MALVLLLGLGMATIDMLSGARAFVGGESLWAKSQKEASSALARYAHTGDEADYRRYLGFIAVPLGYRRARLALDRAEPDIAAARRGFVDGGIHPDDIDSMVRLYRHLGDVSFMARAIEIWRQGDARIDVLMQTAGELHRRSVEHDPDLAARLSLARQAEAVDRDLAPLEQAFASTLGEASRRTESILQLTLLCMACVLAGAGIWLARHVARRAGAAEAAWKSSEERLRLAGSASNDGLWDWDLRTQVIYHSPRVAELLGCEAQALAPDGSSFHQRIHPEDRAIVRQTLIAHLRDRERYEIEIRLLHADGAYRWFQVRGQSLRDADGRAIRMAGSLKDITDRKRDEAAIQRQAMQQGLIAAFGQLALTNPEADELMSRAVAVVNEGLGVTFCRLLAATADDRVLVLKAGTGWNAEWASRATYDAVAETEDRFIIGAREAIVIDDFERETRFKPSEVLLAHRVRSAAELLICGAHGSYGVLGIYAPEPGRFTQESVNFLHGLTNTIASAMDRKVAEERLTYMAQFDPLTSLPNRSMVLDRLWQTITQAARGQKPVGVLFVDLDRFKIVNDTLGHGAGDELLLQVAQRLQRCIRPGDTVGRLGGDEFALALADLAKAEDAGVVANKIVAALAAPFELCSQQVYVSASIGISICPTDGTEPDQLLKNADTAMYRAKQAGRNNHQFFRAEMNERSAERLKIETQLRGALDRGEFLLHYQPKVDLASGQISGFEALLRWQHPERGLVPPIQFISILEETGLIIPVGEWVIEQACRQLAAWRAAGLPPRPIAVNLSARQFGQRDLDAIVGDILCTHAIGPGLLELELTESMLMHDPEAAVRVLKSMKSYGIRLAVDDFGTGYSSLAYLKRFPLDALKIDRAFIRDVTNDPDDATIAIAIINLARSLNLDVVAEGVETAAQLDFLRVNGCTEMQGYYFARPMPAAAATQAVQEGWCLARLGAPRRTAGARPVLA